MAVSDRESLRPTNVARSLFHVLSGVVALAAIRSVPSRRWLVGAAGAIFVAAWAMETSRRRSEAINERLMRLFGPVAHAHERHRVNSSTWYATALLALALFAPLVAAEIGVLVLAIADPAAGMMGRRFGRVRFASGRSLEGALTFLVVAFAVAFAWLSLAGAVPLSARLMLAAGGAVAGAVTELGAVRVDDNLSIPLVVAASVTATGALAGVVL